MWRNLPNNRVLPTIRYDLYYFPKNTARLQTAGKRFRVFFGVNTKTAIDPSTPLAETPEFVTRPAAPREKREG